MVHYDQCLTGILAAIKLKDYDQLKKIAGADPNIFFGKKGAFDSIPDVEFKLIRSAFY